MKIYENVLVNVVRVSKRFQSYEFIITSCGLIVEECSVGFVACVYDIRFTGTLNYKENKKGHYVCKIEEKIIIRLKYFPYLYNCSHENIIEL